MKLANPLSSACITTMINVKRVGIYRRTSGVPAEVATGIARIATSSTICLLALFFVHRILPLYLGRPIEENPLEAKRSSPTKARGSCCFQNPTLAEAYELGGRF